MPLVKVLYFCVLILRCKICIQFYCTLHTAENQYYFTFPHLRRYTFHFPNSSITDHIGEALFVWYKFQSDFNTNTLKMFGSAPNKQIILQRKYCLGVAFKSEHFMEVNVTTHNSFLQPANRVNKAPVLCFLIKINTCPHVIAHLGPFVFYYFAYTAYMTPKQKCIACIFQR